VVRFEIGEELPLASGGYRKIRPDYSRFAADLAPSLPSSDDEDTLRVSIIDATKRYFEAKGFNTDWDGINGLGLVELITSLGMACPFDPMEKQALLEAESVEDRAKTLTQIMTMATLSDSVESNAAVN
jgi:Lon protease-like protein